MSEDFDKQIVELLFEWRAECSRHSEELSSILEKIVNLMTVGIRDKVSVAVAAAITPDALAEAIKKLGIPLPAPGPVPAAPSPVVKVMGYRSQWDDDAKQQVPDCGPTCVAMILGWRDTVVSIDAISQTCGMGAFKKYTDGSDLAGALGRYGVRAEAVRGWTLEAFADRLPAIVLVHYEDLPRMDMAYLRGHWVVVTKVGAGLVTYHDPDWMPPRRDEGANRSVTVDVFKKAMANCAKDGNPPGYGVVLL